MKKLLLLGLLIVYLSGCVVTDLQKFHQEVEDSKRTEVHGKYKVVYTNPPTNSLGMGPSTVIYGPGNFKKPVKFFCFNQTNDEFIYYRFEYPGNGDRIDRIGKVDKDGKVTEIQKNIDGVVLSLRWMSDNECEITYYKGFSRDNLYFTRINWNNQQAEQPETHRVMISPHLKAPITKYQNLIYCSTAQIAWNMLKDEALDGEDVQLEGDPLLAAYLNIGLGSKDDLSEKDYIAEWGIGKDNIVDKINENLADKFPDKKPISEKVEDLDLLFYTYLFKQLEFKEKFDTFRDPFIFKSKEDEKGIESFGIEGLGDDPEKQAEQVKILHKAYNKDEKLESFIVELKTKDPDDRLILASIEPEATLLETIIKSEKQIQTTWRLTKGDIPQEMGILQIPKFDLDVSKSYKEIEEKKILNYPPYEISKVKQHIKFRLDERGVLLESDVIMIGGFGHEPDNFIFNKPFLIYLKEKETKYPYFAMWVGNSSYMVKRKSVEELIETLRSKDEIEWRNAALFLAKKGPEAAPYLEEALNEEKPIGAIYALNLLNSVFDWDELMRTDLVLGKFMEKVPNAKRIVGKLKDIWANGDIDSRVFAMYAVSYIVLEERLNTDLIIKGLQKGNLATRKMIYKDLSDNLFHLPYAAPLDDSMVMEYGFTIREDPDEDAKNYSNLILTQEGHLLFRTLKELLDKGDSEEKKIIQNIFDKLPEYILKDVLND